MESIKQKIRQHLTKVTEATAKKIGAAIGMKDYPTDVVKALSEMRTDAEVECEKRKGQGNEYWYWLTNVQANVTLTNKGDMPTDKECCNAAKVVATTAGSEVAALNARIEAMEEEIAQRNVEVASLNAKLKNAINRADNMNGVCEKWTELATEFECKGVTELRVFINSLVKRTEELKAAANETQVVDVKDADYYGVYRQSRGIQRFKKLETAKIEAEVGARVDGQAELYAMVLVDVAKNGAVWNGRKAA